MLALIAVLFGTAGLLLMIHWLGLHGDFLAATVGAAILVVGFQYCASAARISETKPVQWLGRRSFSLYLVHEPIVVTAIFVTHATAPAVPMLIAIPCSLAATVVMYALVERPTQRLARESVTASKSACSRRARPDEPYFPGGYRRADHSRTYSAADLGFCDGPSPPHRDDLM